MPSPAAPRLSTTGRTARRERLRGFRAGFRGCFTGWADAGFEVTDALLTTPGRVACTPALSLEPVFRRSHGSLYKALSRGGIDAEQMRCLLTAHRPADWPAVFAVDASTWPRCDAECSPGRGFYYSASKHSAGQPIVAGWSYQWITGLGWANDSWTAPVDAIRLPAGGDATMATVGQIRDVTARLAQDGGPAITPTFVFDAGYDPIALTYELADTEANLVVRIRDDRAFHTDPPEHLPGVTGRPRRHGHRFKCADPATWPAPNEQITSTDPRYGTVTVKAWQLVHPRLGRSGHWTGHQQPPIVPGTVVRVDVQHLPKPTSRAKKTLWLWVAGPDPDLHVCWRAYLRRFDIEHTFRFVKNTLGWTTPRWCTPNRPTPGPGSSSPPTPSYAWPEHSSPTAACHGNAASNPTGSHQHGSDGRFVDLPTNSAHQPTHRNPARPDPDGPKAPAPAHEPATPPSRRPPDHHIRV